MNNQFARSAAFRQPWITGFFSAIPILLGYIPIGFAYGILAQHAGISTLNTLLMSLLVFAGSAQFIAVGLLASGGTMVSVVIATFIVNLRHMLMSAALSPHLKHWRKRELVAFAFQLTDETFAVHSARFESDPFPAKTEVFGVNVTAQGAWLLGTWIGTLAVQMVSDVKLFSLDYVLPAMFIALLALQIKETLYLLVALTAGVFSVVFWLWGWDQWNVIVATLIAATIGVSLQTWMNKRFP